MNSKIVGVENQFFSQMVVDAIMAVKTFDDYGNPTCAFAVPRRRQLRALPPLLSLYLRCLRLRSAS